MTKAQLQSELTLAHEMLATLQAAEYEREEATRRKTALAAATARNLKRQAARNTPPQTTGVAAPLITHARLDHCPTCNEKLERINLSEIIAVKHCLKCKRKFEYTRTDTKEGRSQRAREWRALKDATVAPIELDGNGKVI